MTVMILAQLSDLHIEAPEARAYCMNTAQRLDLALASLLAGPARPDVVLLSGDLADTGQAVEYQCLKQCLAVLDMPVYMIPGNHDDRDALRRAFPEHAWLRQQQSGHGRIDYVVEDHALRIVALDTLIPGSDAGCLHADTLDWLEERLAARPDVPTLLMLHHPPMPSGHPFMDRIGLNVDGKARLARLLARQPQVVRVVCGHEHRSINARIGNTPVTVCPSTAHRIVLDFHEGAAPRFEVDAPAWLLHVWTPGGDLITHACDARATRGPLAFR